MITDMTGANGYYGKSQYNVAKLWAKNINDGGGLLGKQVEIVLADGASDPATYATQVKKMLGESDVDVITGGVNSDSRAPLVSAIPAAGKLYFYPQNYEGGQCSKYAYMTGPTPNHTLKPSIDFVMGEGAKSFYLPGSDYVWPHTMIPRASSLITGAGGSVTGEDYFPLDSTDFSATVRKLMSAKSDAVFSFLVPNAVWIFFQQLYDAGFQAGGGKLIETWIDETAFQAVDPKYVQGLVACADYYDGISDQYSAKLKAQYDSMFKDGTSISASGTAGMHRGLQLWATAVKAANTVDTAAVDAALQSAKTDEALGGPASIQPNTNHCVFNMYLAVVEGKSLVVKKSMEQVPPLECSSGVK